MSGWETRLSNLEGLSAEEKGFVTCKLLLLDDDAKAARFFVGDDKATVNILKGLLPQAGEPTREAVACAPHLRPSGLGRGALVLCSCKYKP